MKSIVCFICLFAVILSINIDVIAQKNKKPFSEVQYSEKDTNLIIATTILPLTKTLPECNLGNIITDAFLWNGLQYNKKTDAAFIPFSSIKMEYISPGEITVGIIKNILPQKTELVLAEVTGKQVSELCQSLARKGGGCIAGITFTIDEDKATEIKINNEDLNPNIYYHITLPEFLLKNEDYYNYLYKSKYTKLHITLSNAVIKYLLQITQQGNNINTALQGRIQYK